MGFSREFKRQERKVKRAFTAILIAFIVYALGVCSFIGIIAWAIIKLVGHFA